LANRIYAPHNAHIPHVNLQRDKWLPLSGKEKRVAFVAPNAQ
jgi:hypothetical protein